MINFDFTKQKLGEVFNITESDWRVLCEIHKETKSPPIHAGALVRRLWLDERLSDNAKCFSIFAVGFEVGTGHKDKEE